jgi:hypothetical protein
VAVQKDILRKSYDSNDIFLLPKFTQNDAITFIAKLSQEVGKSLAIVPH